MSKNPLVSFCLICYNQENYISEAIEGAFRQQYSPLEIIISDDCSSDSTFEIVKKMAKEYQGPHHLILNRNPSNIGLTGNVNYVFSRAKGIYVVLAAGDDISLPERTSLSVQLTQAHPASHVISLGLCSFSNSQPPRLEKPNASQEQQVEKFSINDYLQGRCKNGSGASRIYSRSIFEIFGPIEANCPTEDSTLLLRGLLLGEISVSAYTGVYYRTHDTNLSGEKLLPQMNLLGIITQYILDSTLACNKKYITAHTYFSLLNNFTKVYEKRTLYNIYLSSGKSYNSILSILQSSTYTIKEKYKLLKKIMRNCLS